MSTPGAASTFTIELPESVLIPFAGTPEAFAREVRLAAAIEWYRQGRVSQGKAAEVAGLGRDAFLEALHRARVPASQATVDEVMSDVDRAVGTQAPAFAPDEAARHYDCLGAWRGPLSARAVQDEALEFWRSTGEDGVRWLVRRLRDEHHVDALHGVASLLADLGEGILGPVFEELSSHASSDQALALLRALGWLGESKGARRLKDAQAELVLADLLQDNEADVREAAAQALRLLSQEKAVRWLTHRLRDEADEEVRATIEDELKRTRVEKE
jgi:predicted HTH domain antitoxin